jgi:hypothetical protein
MYVFNHVIAIQSVQLECPSLSVILHHKPFPCPSTPYLLPKIKMAWSRMLSRWLNVLYLGGLIGCIVSSDSSRLQPKYIELFTEKFATCFGLIRAIITYQNINCFKDMHFLIKWNEILFSTWKLIFIQFNVDSRCNACRKHSGMQLYLKS